MSEQIKTGWLKDNGDNKFAPMTIIDNVFNIDGTVYSNQIQIKLEKLENAIDEVEALIAKITLASLGISYGTSDLTAGSSTLKTGSIYLVYE